MTRRIVHLVRHGAADAWGNLTDIGREQCHLLAERLAVHPIDAIWHSPLSRASDSAAVLASRLPEVYVDQAAELVDHVPFVPPEAEQPTAWRGFFDGFDRAEAELGHAMAQRLVDRFASPPQQHQRSTREVLVTHAYPIAWLVRHAFGAPKIAWMSVTRIANTAVTTIELSDVERPSVTELNDQSHLPQRLRWSGFSGSATG